MADDDVVQPPSSEPSSGAGGSSPYSAPSGFASSASERKPEASPHEDDANELDDGERPEKTEKFRDVFDFLVGINPDRIANAVIGTSVDVLETGFTAGMESVRAMFRGGGGEAVQPEGPPATPSGKQGGKTARRP